MKVIREIHREIKTGNLVLLLNCGVEKGKDRKLEK